VIREKADVEVECFIHGAMCYSYSGMCLMSSMIGGRSGNRGSCAGICRLPFRVEEEENTGFQTGRMTGSKKPHNARDRRGSGSNAKQSRVPVYPLNMKDLCALPLLPELIEAGISSFKIEGRMKKPEYTYGVTSIYRENIDRYLASPETYRLRQEDMTFLETLFSREGFTTGYYTTRGRADMIARVKDANSDTRATKEVSALYEKIREAREAKPRKIPVTAVLKLEAGSEARLTLSDGTHMVTCKGARAEEAKSQPMTDERIAGAVEKFGDSHLVLRELTIERMSDKPLFIPVGALNRLRRDAITAFLDEIRKQYRRSKEEIADVSSDEHLKDGQKRSAEAMGAREDRPRGRADLQTNNLRTRSDKFESPVFISVRTREQLSAVLRTGEFATFKMGLSLPLILANELAKAGTLAQAVCRDERHPLRVELPWLIRTGDLHRIDAMLTGVEEALRKEGRSLCGILIRNLEGAGFLKETGRLSLAIADGALYTMNRRAEDFLKETGISQFTAPLELNERELSGRMDDSTELILYGRAPMMITAGCVNRTMNGCDHKNGTLFLSDRKGAEFPVQCNCTFCHNVIYNSLPTSLLRDLDAAAALGAASYRLEMTYETEEEIRTVLTALNEAVSGGTEGPDFPVTRGHFHRKVL
jgi:putative protease